MNRTPLSFRATWRTRSRSLDTPSPALRPGRGSLAAFPLAGRLPSPASAAAETALFDRLTGTTQPSDSPRSCIKGLPPRRSPHGPPPAGMPPREPRRGGASPTGTGDHRGLPVLSTENFVHARGAMTARGPPTARANAVGDKAFRFFVERRHPGLRSISRLDPSACTTPTHASPPPSRTADARLGADNRFATPSSWSTHSSFSVPVVRRFHKALLARSPGQ